MTGKDDPKTQAFRAQVPRYVSGSMSPAERLEFEAWLITHPELAEEIELERRLRVGMASAQRRGLIRRPLFSPERYRWSAAIAASIALVAITAMVMRSERDGRVASLAERGEHIQEHATSPNGARVVRLSATRSASDAPNFRASVADLPEHLVVQPDVVVLTCSDGVVDLTCSDGNPPSQPQYREYDLEVVQRSSGQQVWRSRPIPPDANASLVFVVHPRELAVGDYELLVHGRDDSHEETVGRYWLQVAANP
jgi:hypothetical protein